MASQSFPRTFWRTVRPFVYWSPSAVFFGYNFYYVRQINGRSMQPTLNPDSCSRRDVALFSIGAVKYSDNYGRGDIVSLTSPRDPNKTMVKRIIAMGGDTVQTLPPYPDREVVVPENHIWVEGDEHFVSEDSNHFGPIPAGLLQAKLVALIWPPERFGVIKRPSEVVQDGLHMKNSAVMTELRKEQRRQARVKVAEPESNQLI